MQKCFSLRALVDECGIISPDVANKSSKLTLYSNAQIEIAKTYRSEHPPKNNKNQDAGTDYTTSTTSKSAGKKTYLVNPHESLVVTFNRLNIYLRDNGAFNDARADYRC